MHDALHYLNATLWKHQEESVLDYAERRYKALFFEMGCGKTLTAIACHQLKVAAEKRHLWTLVLCPSIVVENWYREFRKYTPAVVGDTVVKLEGPGRDRVAAFRAAMRDVSSRKRIFVTNIDVITAIPELWKLICAEPWDFLIVDESHRFKGNNTKRSKALHRFADKVKYKLILSGSPVLQDERDLWSQFRILDKDILGDNFYAFQSRHFVNKNANKRWLSYPDWQLAPGSEKFFARLLAAHSDRVTKDEVLDLPPLTRQTVYVDLSDDAYRHYKQMERDFVTSLGEEALIADIVLTKMLRLQQIVSGILPLESGPRRIETEKKAALKELLEQLCPQRKVIVWACFRACIEDIAALCDDLGLYFVTIQGEQSAEERQEAIDSFNNDPKISVCVANQSAGGVGIGLQAASYMIYYAKTHNLEHDLQSESRAHRGGSEIHDKITRIDIVTRGTVEEEITEALLRKQSIGDLLFQLRKALKRAA